jgi:hypothetical protein
MPLRFQTADNKWTAFIPSRIQRAQLRARTRMVANRSCTSATFAVNPIDRGPGRLVD